MKVHGKSQRPGKKALLICLDGCGPDYIRRSDVPNIRQLCKEGVYVDNGLSMVPTVTNVNNVSLITGVYPEGHGITSNCYYDRYAMREVYMESPSFITVETFFEKAAKLQLSTALLTVKDKLRTLLSRGAQVSISAENPPPWIIEDVGEPPSIYSIDVDAWLFDALQVVLRDIEPDFTYVATTDYAMHRYSPEDQESRNHMALIDAHIGGLVERLKDYLICVTSDHGMSDKEPST